jgi:hypothetical protein
MSVNKVDIAEHKYTRIICKTNEDVLEVTERERGDFRIIRPKPMSGLEKIS